MTFFVWFARQLVNPSPNLLNGWCLTTCAPCSRAERGTHQYNLGNYDVHRKGKPHMDGMERYQQWCQLLDDAPNLVIISTVKQNALHCLVCDLSPSPRSILHDVGPFFDHARGKAHKARCEAEGVESIPTCLLDNKQKKEGLLCLWGPMVATGSASTNSPPSVNHPLPSSAGSLLVAVGASKDVVITEGTVVVVMACSGTVCGERYRALYEVRSDVAEVERAAREYNPAKGKNKARDALPFRPAKLYDYTISIESGEVIVRSKQCTMLRSCTECKKINVVAIQQRAASADVIAAKADYFEARLCQFEPQPQTLALLDRERKQLPAAKTSSHFLNKPLEGQTAYLKSVLAGMRAQSATLTSSFACRLQTLELREEKFALISKVAEVGELSPAIRQYVMKLSEGGMVGKQMEGILDMYVNGDAQESYQALFGMMAGASEKCSRERRGITTSSGIPLDQGAINLLLAVGV